MNIRYQLLLSAAIAVSVGGCDSIGQTPAGGSDAEVKATFDKMPLDQRVKMIMGSPAPADKKAELIKAAYAKDGKQVPDDVLKGVGGTVH